MFPLTPRLCFASDYPGRSPSASTLTAAFRENVEIISSAARAVGDRRGLTINTRNHPEIAPLESHMRTEIVDKQYLSLSFEKSCTIQSYM